MQEIEIWKDIPGFIGLYQASNLGRIKSLKRKNVRNDRVLTQSINKDYYKVNLNKNLTKTRIATHRLVALAFILNPLNRTDINHIDGDKLNNKADNLEWTNDSENAIHAFKLGLRSNAKGENSKLCKLTDLQIQKIKTLYLTNNYSYSELAKKYQVSTTSIGNIITGNFRKSNKLIKKV